MIKTLKEIQQMSVNELVKEINFYAKAQKERTLKPEELTYQKQLRKRYVELYRQSLQTNLDSIKIVNKQGLDVTPKKLKDKQKKK